MTMERKGGHVNGRRGYDARRRRASASRTRDRVVDSARELFLRDGYAGTTVASVADRAGVSVETVYKGFGGKAGLVRAVFAAGLAGVGQVPAEDRSDAVRETEPDPHVIVEGWGALTTEVMPQVGPLMLLVRAAAAADPAAAVLYDELNDSRLRRMAVNAASLARGGHLRPGVTAEKARDVMFAFSAPELYELLVLGRGWDLADYGRFVADGLAGALLEPT